MVSEPSYLNISYLSVIYPFVYTCVDSVDLILLGDYSRYCCLRWCSSYSRRGPEGCSEVASGSL